MNHIKLTPSARLNENQFRLSSHCWKIDVVERVNDGTCGNSVTINAHYIGCKNAPYT